MSRGATRRRRRGELTRAEVVTTALAIVDSDGLDALTMRRLASDVGCGLMTLYTHVWNREDLLRAIVERVLEEIDFHNEPGDTWADVLRRAGEAYRAMAQRHPAAFGLVAAAPADRPPVVTHLARAAAILCETGLSEQDAFAVLAILDAFATGLFVTDVALKSAAADTTTETPAADPGLQRFRDYAGDEVWRQGTEAIIAGAQHVLGLPPVD
jgi:AcrR family transcriptional regulator